MPTHLEELDSYLYQTVGQDAIEFITRALDVPLHRRVISGAAVEQGSEYGARNAEDPGGVLGDETEDLYSLLLTVKVCFILFKRHILAQNQRSHDIRMFKAFPWVPSSRIIRGYVWNMCEQRRVRIDVARLDQYISSCGRLSLTPLCYL